MRDTTQDLQDAMAQSAAEAAGFLRTMSNPSRLLLLCQLIEGEKSVGELEAALGLGQAYVSQQLARLRADELVVSAKDGRIVRDSISDPRVISLVQVLYELFCRTEISGEPKK